MRRITPVFTLILLLGTLASVPLAQAQSSYTEDFSTHEFHDQTQYSSADWDTVSAQLKQNVFVPNSDFSAFAPFNGFKIARDGTRVIISEGSGGIRIYDVTANTFGSRGTLSTIGSGYTRGVAIDGYFAYLADGANGIVAVDITDLSSPVETGQASTGGYAWDVAVSGNRAYVAVGSSGMDVFDISNAGSPVLITTFALAGNTESVSIDGDTAYLASSAGLHIVDIQNPSVPSLISSTSLPAAGKDVFVAGNLAYVANHSAGLQIFDITDRAFPFVVGSVDTPGTAQAVHIDGDMAFLADGYSGVQAIDVSDPSFPTIDNTYNRPDFAGGVTVDGSQVLIAEYTTGLHIAEFSRGTSPTLRGRINANAGRVGGIHVRGNLSYSSTTSMLVIADISDEMNPNVLSSAVLPNNPILAMEVAGQYAYTAMSNNNSLEVYDISDSAAPVLASSSASGSTINGLAIVGNYAYGATEIDGLDVYDISDPQAVAFVVGVGSANTLNDVEVAGNYAYVASSAGLMVYDLSSPALPLLVATEPTGSEAISVKVNGSYCYVGCQNSTFETMNIVTPGTPINVSSSATSGPVADIDIVGSRAYLAVGSAGIEVYGIPYPYSPDFIEVNNATGDDFFAVATDGDILYTGSSANRLALYRIAQDEYWDSTTYSKRLTNSTDTVRRVRFTPTQAGTVDWKVRTRFWSTAGDLIPETGSWFEPTYQSGDLYWTAITYWNPDSPSTVDNVTIEWLYDHATVEAVSDIGNDQGKQVRVEWSRSGHDFIGDTNQIVEYGVYRKVDTELVNKAAAVSTAGQSPAMQAHSATEKASGWDFVASHQVLVQDRYSVVVPTLADSTISGGQYYSTFKVIALSGTPGVFYESHPDSGYSSDNLAPSVPMGVSASYLADSVMLDWTDANETDVQYYRVYRSDDPGFIPSPATMVMQVATSAWTDPLDDAWNEHYKITAVDFSGNESLAGYPEFASDVPGSTAAKKFALHNASPNPFNPATKIAFDLPRSSQVRLSIHDLAGRLVKTLVSESLAAGSHEVMWDGRNNDGGRVSSGVYLYRIEAGSFAETRRMVLVK